MNDGFVRVAAATPDIRVADTAHNARQIRCLLDEAPADTALVVFPELCVTGYTCGDLFLQPTLLRAAEEAVRALLDQTADRDTIFMVGVPPAVQLRRRLPTGPVTGAGTQNPPAQLLGVLRSAALCLRPGHPHSLIICPAADAALPRCAVPL